MKEILLDNRNGNVWDISELIVSMSYKTSRIGKPSDLSLTCLKKESTKARLSAITMGT
ncbi:hypothetical protein [Paenibacillus larvae]|uniref:hypothetical protein n=1 Tax=Paenibacillus larvae TaxID=1464 RepID=UPI0028BD987F|nr:hypothetical protein [Paenibacillus larvae]